MRKILKTGAATLMLTAMSADICAAAEQTAGCAYPVDLYAVRAAAIQQNLMTAASSCHAFPEYDRFVTQYHRGLWASDLRLEVFFSRLYGQDGPAKYNSFRKRLANASSLQSVNHRLTYCANAKASFELALGHRRKSLTAFLAARPSRAEAEFSPCIIVPRARMSRSTGET
ncbi:MAG TPA: hypothetical protein VFW28_04135 [Micropepsaceae bacterium]|nr:hypothetical protein [Micropepsaceae bacterium]